MSQYISSVKAELKKCSWPWENDPKIKGFKKYRELSGSTLVVLIAMILLGAYVAFFDLILSTFFTWTITQLS
ncbi:MAG: preprotein translocase subunit SecE [Akkermansia sp.]